MKLWTISGGLLMLYLLPVAAGAQPVDEPGAASRAAPSSLPAAAPTTRPAPAAAPRPAPAARQTEYRFDALRVDGQLHGPEALVVHGMARAGHARLLKVRRSFLHRILETVEEPCLHRGGTHD